MSGPTNETICTVTGDKIRADYPEERDSSNDGFEELDQCPILRPAERLPTSFSRSDH
jgi:hypothetical protein